MARNFVFTHLIGPLLAQGIVIYLYRTDPDPGFACWTIIACIYLFWALPFVYRKTRSLRLSATLSVQLLTFTSLFGTYFYGGVSSPFLPWLIVALLLGFFYLSDRPFIVIGLFAGNFLGLMAAYATFGFASIVPIEELTAVGWISIFSATVYMSWMALYYANVMSMRSEIERETELFRQATEKLEEANSEQCLRHRYMASWVCFSVDRLHDLAGSNERAYSLFEKGQEIPPHDRGDLHALDMNRRPVKDRGRSDLCTHFKDCAPCFLQRIEERVRHTAIRPSYGRVRRCAAICKDDQKRASSAVIVDCTSRQRKEGREHNPPVSCRCHRGGTLVQLLDPCGIPFARHRPAVEISLDLAASFFEHADKMSLRLDAFGNRGDPEAVAEIGNRLDNGRRFRALDRILDERTVDLDLVEGEGAQMGERGIADEYDNASTELAQSIANLGETALARSKDRQEKAHDPHTDLRAPFGI